MSQTQEIEFDLEEMKQISEVFFKESQEIFDDLNRLILNYESQPESQFIFNAIYRRVHTIKGSLSAIPGHQILSSLAHQFEEVLIKIKNSNVLIEKSTIGYFLKATKLMYEMILDIQREGSVLDDHMSESIDLIALLDKISFTSKVRSEKPNMQIVKEKPVVLESEDGVWLSMDHIYQLSEITSELLVAKNQLTLEQKEKIHENSESMELIKKIEKISERLQKYSNDVRKVKVIPPYSDLHVILRQLSNELNKEVDFTVVGGDIELDRLVVKDIHTCLIHLIRNSLDHGLEDLLTRVEHGKPPKGQVQIEISESHGKIILLYSDDGQGLDRERILNKIIEKEVATPEAAALMTDQQIFQSIFLSGLSTKAVPNFVSGRGIGMDVVHDIFVNKYKGNISLESEKNQGVRFRFQFQMQNQIQIEKTLVGVSQKICVGAPISALWSVQAVDDLSINQVGEVRCIQFQGKTIPTFFYKELIERKISLKQNINPGSFVWIFYGRQNPFGILIDAMETQQDLVIKPISQFIQDMIVFKGASVLSNKEICYIFDEYKIEEVLNEYK